MVKGPNTFGGMFRVTTFGESHGPAMGLVLDGVAPGLVFDLEPIQEELDRRRPGQSVHTTSRKEPDKVEVLSGVYQGRTTGAPLCLMVKNVDAQPGAYEEIKELFRPGHADFSIFAKYGIRDPRGGGRSSGRETLCRVAAGAVAKEMLKARGVSILGFTRRVGPIDASLSSLDDLLKKGKISEVRDLIEKSPLRCPDPESSGEMERLLSTIHKEGDSLGSIVEVRILGVPAGWGDPTFWKLDSEISAATMSIGGVKGVGFGAGFSISKKRGSEANDAMSPNGFKTNRAGGVLGGISNGAPIVVRLGIKPTPSINLKQQTIDTKNQPREIQVKGRHDPCLAPRVVPVAEAMIALVLAEAALRQDALKGANETQHARKIAHLRSWEDFLEALERIRSLQEMEKTDPKELNLLFQHHGLSHDEIRQIRKWVGKKEVVA